jgi:hypothetical protein
MNDSNQRLHTRAPCFLLRTGSGLEFVPVFAFRASDEPDAIAALVVDISVGGLQILSQSDANIQSSTFKLELIQSDIQTHAVQSLHTCEVQWVWSKSDGMYLRSGFSFRTGAERIPSLIEQLNASEHHLLRCVLHSA